MMPDPKLGDPASRCVCCGRYAEQTEIWGEDDAGVTCVEIDAYGTFGAALCCRCQTALHTWSRAAETNPDVPAGPSLMASFMGADSVYDACALAHAGAIPIREKN